MCSGLRCPVQQLRMHLNVPDEQLMKTIRQHMPLAALTLSATPAAVEWLPQLRHCTILVQNAAHLDVLETDLDEDTAQLLPQLCRLSVYDQRPGSQREALPPTFRGLQHLPALRKLVRSCLG